MGQKFDMDGNGQMITRECPEKRCIVALAALENPVIQIYERFIAHSDPNNERSIDAASSSQAFTVIAGPPGTAAV